MELNKFQLQVVHRIPEQLNYGTLYVCFECNVISHLCACGCDKQVVLPIAPDFWSVSYDGETVSVTPSVGNYQFPCQSHYWIKDNRVIWVNDVDLISNLEKSNKRKKNRLLDILKTLFRIRS